MAKVSLRIYNREIESLIDRGSLDEAIAHCHHILKTFSKHLETYRLLGKAFLEAKHYNEAVDIFNRVLVSVPDDFVSHVGMSIINDEQNKLDDAIWHMERAFEAQPSNAAIQGELQRLYGRRDGMEPPKIRMTRGALAHMYVQGELYPQAISEIRAVLQEDPQRADMQVLLAIAYFRGGQRADASDVCAQLLKKYAYCFDANRVLVELLPGSERAESTQVYRLRVYELDPYATFTQGSVFNSGEVADAAVSLERLEYSGQDVLAGQDWGASLGVGLVPSPSSDQQPDWLKSGMSASSAEPQPFDQAKGEPVSVSQSQDGIPDFLRDAGWNESSGAGEERSSAFAGDAAADDLAPAELPDWMKAMAPLQPAQSVPSTPPVTSSTDTPDWLAGLGAMGATSAAQPANESQSGGPVSSQADIPDWLSGASSEPQAASQSSSMDETSAWLKNLGDEQSASAQPTSASDLPDWLHGPDEEQPAQPAATSDIPDWLSPEPTKPSTPSVPAASLETLGTSAQEQDDAVSWLESLASKHGAKPEELVTDPNSRSDTPPEWVDQAREIAQSQPPAQKPAASLETLGTSAKEQDDAVSWLESLASKHGAKPEELVTDPSSRSDTPPDWVDQAREIGLSQPPVPFAQEPAPYEDAETSDWLANLAADSTSQPVDWQSAESESKPLDWNTASSDELTPLWNELSPAQNTQDDSALEQPQEPMFKETPLKETPATTDLPDWLRDFEREPQKPISPSVDNIPSWLGAEEETFNSEFQPEPESEPEPEPEPITSSDWHPVEPATRKIGTPQMEEDLTPPPARPQQMTQTTQPAPGPAQPKAATPKSRAASPRTRSVAVPPRTTESTLSAAQSELTRGSIPSALEHYNKLIKKGRVLDEIIRDLRDALYRYPIEVSIWQALGDAYMRSNRLQEALDAYTKAEELLR